MRRVVVESPYAGNIVANVAYARSALRDCVLRGESPIASHLLLTQEGVLRDELPGERKLGIDAGHAWIAPGVCDAVVVYTDFGVSGGMHDGIAIAKSRGVTIEFRSLNAGQKPA